MSLQVWIRLVLVLEFNFVVNKLNISTYRSSKSIRSIKEKNLFFFFFFSVIGWEQPSLINLFSKERYTVQDVGICAKMIDFQFINLKAELLSQILKVSALLPADNLTAEN